MKKVVATNLSMRFYKVHGWDEDQVKEFISSESRNKEIIFFDDGPGAYWIPAHGTSMDLKKIIELPVRVVRSFNDFPHETDYEHLERVNW